LEREILEDKVLESATRGIEDHAGEGTTVARELEAGLVKVVRIKVEVAEGMDEFAGAEVADLRDHEGEEGVGGDVEGNAEEKIGAALVELAAQFAVLHEELEHRVAGGEGHEVEFRGVPGRDDEAATVRIFLNVLNNPVDLIDDGAVRAAPRAPLSAIDAAEVAVFIGPFVPNGDAVFAERADVGVSPEEPEEFVDDRAEVEFFGGEEGKGVAEIEAFLRAENGKGAGAGAVGFGSAVFKDESEKAVVLLHETAARLTRNGAGVKRGGGDFDEAEKGTLLTSMIPLPGPRPTSGRRGQGAGRFRGWRWIG